MKEKILSIASDLRDSRITSYQAKDLVSMHHVYLLIACLSDFGDGSYIPDQHIKLSKRIKEMNQPTNISDLNIPKPPKDRKWKEGTVYDPPKFEK